jgi:hypothetical protein
MTSMLKLNEVLNELHASAGQVMAQDAAGFQAVIEGIDEVKALFAADLETLKTITFDRLNALMVVVTDVQSVSTQGHQALIDGPTEMTLGVQK